MPSDRKIGERGQKREDRGQRTQNQRQYPESPLPPGAWKK